MDRLISLEPSNLVPVRVEPGQKCRGDLTLRNVMYTMPVAFRLHAMNKTRYTVRPHTGIISPLATLTVEIIYEFPPNSSVLPASFPHSDDSFLLHSVVVPGAASSSTLDSVPNDWFTTKKKQVFIDSGIKIIFVGSPILAQLVAVGSMDEVREVLERSDSSWQPADSVDAQTGQTLLHLAIGQSRADLVQLLLEFDPNVEAPSRSGRTPLEAAAGAGEELIVELLLAHRASTDRSTSSKLGPIHLAATEGHVEVMRLLLMKGADVDAITDEGDTALHLAVEEQRRDCAILLLASGASPDIRNNVSGDTPLHIAAGLGDEQMVKQLLQKGANKDIRNQIGKTSYDVAAEYGHSRLYDALRLGDNLCTAARKGEVRTIHRLLENGASVNGRDQHGWTALHRAAFKGRIDVVRTLLEKGVDVDVDVNARDEDGYTALHCATESGQAEVIEMLVKKGADVEARTNKGVTALQIGNSLQYSGITRILMQGGAIRHHKAPAAPPPLKFRSASVGQEVVEKKKKNKKKKKKKKKHTRTRTISNNSFGGGRSMPLVVL